nr:hypothetical protein [Morchella crassipes]
MKGDNFALCPRRLHRRASAQGADVRQTGLTFQESTGHDCSAVGGRREEHDQEHPTPPFSIAPLPFQTITRVVVMKRGPLGGHPTPLFPINEKGGGFAILC